MRLDKISERVYANCEGLSGGNVGIVLLEDSVAAVDAQYPVSAADFRGSISSVTEMPATHLLLTHIHGDHVFGNQVFEDCKIISHRRLKEKMEDNLKTVWAPGRLEQMITDFQRNRPERAHLLEGLRIILPNKTFEDHYQLEDVDFIHLGGHTDCSSVVYVPEDKTLFAGDLIFAKTFPWAGDPTADPETWIEAFKMILSMDVENIVPGHGPLCGKEEVKTQLKWFEVVKDEMKKLILDGASEDDVVKNDGYPDFYKSEGERRENSLRHWYRVFVRDLNV